MADVVGAMASIASVTLNISPVRDVLDVHRTGCVNERSILPYCMMMVDGANWVLFAVLIEDAFPIGVTNAFGCMAGTVYSSVYLRNCWHDKRDDVRRRAWMIFLGALCVITIMCTAGVLLSTAWSRDTATDDLGYVIDIFNVLLYGSPLSLAWKVLRTRSTSGMYLPLSIAITAAACLWATYGLLTSDLFVVAPQSVGFFAGIAQLLLFVRFGVADNNQPSVKEPVSEDGSDAGGSLDVCGGGPDNGDGPIGGARSKLSDATYVKVPGGRVRSSGAYANGGQLEEPLMAGTSL